MSDLSDIIDDAFPGESLLVQNYMRNIVGSVISYQDYDTAVEWLNPI